MTLPRMMVHHPLDHEEISNIEQLLEQAALVRRLQDRTEYWFLTAQPLTKASEITRALGECDAVMSDAAGARLHYQGIAHDVCIVLNRAS